MSALSGLNSAKLGSRMQQEESLSNISNTDIQSMKMMRMGNSNISLYENTKQIHSEAPSYEMSQVSFLKYQRARVLLAHDLILKILKGEEKASLEAVQEAFMS